MSQVYQITLTSGITRTIHASDQMTHRIELTPILGEPQMKDVVRASLKERGWEEQEDGTFHKTGDDGETLIWDLEAGQVVAIVEVEKEVSADLSAKGTGGSDEAARRSAERSLNRQTARVEHDIAETETELARETAQTLKDSAKRRERELNDVLQGIYAEALKEKAKELGTVLSIDEHRDGDDYELVIKIAE